jgi:hypothetical protein
MKVYRGVEVQLYTLLLILAVNKGEELASHYDCSGSGKIAPRSHLIRGWVGSRAGLDNLEKRKSLACWESKDSSIQPTAWSLC